MKVIMLTGAPNTGKTWTLKNLYKKLTGRDLNELASVLNSRKRVNADELKAKNDILLPSICPESLDDWECYVEWRGKKVGIVTMGDYASRIIWYLGFYVGIGADILVIADSMMAMHIPVMRRRGIEYRTIQKTSIHETDVEDTIVKKMESMLFM